MMSAGVTFDDTEVRRAFSDWEARLPKLHQLILRRIAYRIVKNTRNYWLSGQALRSRSGLLKAGTGYRTAGASGVMIYSKAWYAAVQERGRVQTGKGGGYLTIPLAGITLLGKPGSLHTRASLGSRRFEDLFPLKMRDGRRFLARRDLGGNVMLMYALKRQVVIPARPFLLPSAMYTMYSGEANRIAEQAAVDYIEKNWGAA